MAHSTEGINDRGKLLLHRLIARQVRHRPELIEDARAVVQRWFESGAEVGITRVPRSGHTVADLDRAARSICRHSWTDAVIVMDSQSALGRGLGGPGPLSGTIMKAS